MYILNLGVFSEVLRNRFTEDAYLPRVVAVGFIRDQQGTALDLIFMKPKRCCTSIVSDVPLLIGVKK